ncbi:XrtB/PEP-CTERM-associated transcriptional regulator EpsA [Thauera sinica]|uniref:XrtB/PEP-CTERM-associated transcriptional regulator EpsA n=1 Tax=Thauera sinica TaxID=2665146 RepID=A0ABW1ANR5_9RHOO|nr:XrtB/PEP-CTERM-associated transcriptional regulator EpsA [Thauera sp. K11]ATE60508.1 transcriptional regulator EpsA [Thauera sp. K11]
MNQAVAVEGDDLERLLMTIDASIRVTRRFQFFLWAQGILQYFIPHETLVCTYGDLESRAVRHDVFSRNVTDPAFDAAMTDSQRGFVMPLIDAWLRRDRKPVSMSCADIRDPALARQCVGHLLCHGAPEARGEQGSFFTFLGLPAQPGHREQYFLGLLMPHLHMALHRMCEGEARERQPRNEESVLSEREIEVLAWVRDGKTNHEIGQILDISPLTVKNHIQRILRKLNVSNRAQAVARGVSSGLLERVADARR